MDKFMDINTIKDILIILMPAIIAFIDYKSNKKTRKDIQLDLEKTLKEKYADTNQILLKIDAELESKKQLISWKNSLPTTGKYTERIGLIRHGNMASLPQMTCAVIKYIQSNNLSHQELIEIQKMLLKINTPRDEDELYPYEVPIMIDFLKLLHLIEEKINKISNG